MSDTSTDCTTDIATIVEGRLGPSWVIVVGGELDLSCREIVSQAFDRASKQPCERIVIDAAGVTFLDGGGLRALLSAAAAYGGEVWLRSASRPVRRVAEIAGLWDEWSGTSSCDEVRIA